MYINIYQIQNINEDIGIIKEKNKQKFWGGKVLK